VYRELKLGRSGDEVHPAGVDEWPSCTGSIVLAISTRGANNAAPASVNLA
jgi:hypothetical protein